MQFFFIDLSNITNHNFRFWMIYLVGMCILFYQFIR